MSEYSRDRSHLFLPQLVACLVLSTWYMTASADFAATEAEYMAWPDYCRAKYGQTNIGAQLGYAGRESPETVRRAQTLLGAFFVHVHHYCWGLAEEKRYLRSKNPGTRAHWLRAATADAVYSLNRILPDNALYPHVVSLTARLHYYSGKPQKAISLLDHALEKRSRSPVLYYHKAFVLRKMSRREDARAVLDTGAALIGEPPADYHYLHGLLCLELGDLDCARYEASRAYSMGYPLPGLARKLERKGIRLE